MKNLKKIRREHNATQLSIQIETGIDQALISKYENGERLPTVENLIALADYFDTSLDYLMGRTVTKKPYPRD